MTSGFSDGYEREECRKMTTGFWHSMIGLLLSPIPGIGLFFAISGFIRQVVRITRKHRFRNAVFTIIALISLVACVGVLAREAYIYSRDTEVVDRLAHYAWEGITGQKEFPWVERSESAGVNYGASDSPGLGIFDEDEYTDDPYDTYGELGDDFSDEDIYFDPEMVPDLSLIMEDIRNPFAQYGF